MKKKDAIIQVYIFFHRRHWGHHSSRIFLQYDSMRRSSSQNEMTCVGLHALWSFFRPDLSLTSRPCVRAVSPCLTLRINSINAINAIHSEVSKKRSLVVPNCFHSISGGRQNPSTSRTRIDFSESNKGPTGNSKEAEKYQGAVKVFDGNI